MTDLLVIGGGVAGMSAAIAAAEAGASVVLVEKQGQLGGSALYSAGNLLQLGDDALAHLQALAFGRTPDDVLAAYVDGLSTLRSRLGAQTADVEYLPNCWPLSPGADDIVYYAVTGALPPGTALVEVLRRRVLELGVEVHLGTRMLGLLTSDGRVTGASFSDGSIVAGATVLTTGGFENDPALTSAYLPVEPVFPVGNPGNTGDGLRAAQDVGAALWHMSVFYGFWCFRALPTAYPLLFLNPAHFIVDGSGRRFHDETAREAHDAMRSVGDFLPTRAIGSLPAYAVIDRQLLASGPLSRFPSPNAHQWSAGNDEEIELGWIRPAPEFADAARRYNAEGPDEFGRIDKQPLDPSDLFAIEIWPGVATTSGGPRRDAHARVLAPSGQPIPGLYAAGGNGGVWGHLTEHGGGLTDALVFGRIAAEHALAVR